jgi:hypothetical protein
MERVTAIGRNGEVLSRTRTSTPTPAEMEKGWRRWAGLGEPGQGLPEIVFATLLPRHLELHKIDAQ